MRVAITGGLGFIGSKIVEDMLKHGHDVIVVDFWEDLITSYEKNKFPIIESIYRSLPRCTDLVTPYDFLQQVRELGPQIIVHAGAVVDTKDLGDGALWNLNVDYTRTLAEKASIAGSHLIFASSAATYGSKGYPNNPYGLSKVLGERAVYRMKTRVSVLRFFNVFGDNEHHKGAMASVPFKLAEAYRTGETFKMFAPEAQRDFVPVNTVVEAVRGEADRMHGPWGGTSRTYDVGTGVATSFLDLDNFVMQATKNTTSCVRLIDMPEELKGRYQGFTQAGHPGSVLYPPYMNTRQGIEHYYGKQG